MSSHTIVALVAGATGAMIGLVIGDRAGYRQGFRHAVAEAARRGYVTRRVAALWVRENETTNSPGGRKVPPPSEKNQSTRSVKGTTVPGDYGNTPPGGLQLIKGRRDV